MQVTEVLNKQHFNIHPFEKGLLNLYLQIEGNRIAASVFNKDNSLLYQISSMRFHEIKSHPENLTHELAFFLKDFDFLKHSYDYVSVQVLNRYFTLVPSAYANGHLKDILAFNLGLKDIKTVQSVRISNSFDFAFTYDFELHGYIEKTFNVARIDHAGATSISLFLKLQLFKNSDVFLNIHTSFIELIIKKENELQFYNIFKWDSQEDILYFLLFSIEQFQLNHTTLRLLIAADLPGNHPLFALIRKYIKSVNFISSKALNTPVENLPNHYYFNILNKHLCEF